MWKWSIHISDKKDFKLEGSKEDLPVFVYAEGKILEIVLDENRKVTIYEHNIPNSPKGLDGLDLKEFVENHSNEDTNLEVPDLWKSVLILKKIWKIVLAHTQDVQKKENAVNASNFI